MKPLALDPDALADLASKALAERTEEDALPSVESAAIEAGTNARLWQWTALLHRALDQHELAIAAFEKAARLSPGDASIAHGHARVVLEAGLDARALFLRALRLSPSGEVILGMAAARYAAREGDAAAAELEMVLNANPHWAQGHVQFSQLMSMIGRPADATRSVDAALSAQPRDAGLWDALIHILAGAERHEEIVVKAEEAKQATGDAGRYALSLAAAQSDSGQLDEARASFDALGDPVDAGHAIHLARYLIRAGELDRLTALADRWMAGDDADQFWPYASICWRKTGDSRAQWLEGDDRLIRVFDLSQEIPSLDRLADRLRQLHSRSGRFLDQSVRGGTQTDGHLFSRIDPEIQALRKAIVASVQRYRDQLPEVDPRHPMLRHRRDGPVRFSGSWSVRLQGSGFHSQHVHPKGWISSAFYTAVPEGLEGEQGWLTVGDPQAELGIRLPPWRRIEPKPGQLVLFPSMMWHGTLPFDSGERMTVAFDIAAPL